MPARWLPSCRSRPPARARRRRPPPPAWAATAAAMLQPVPPPSVPVRGVGVGAAQLQLGALDGDEALAPLRRRYSAWCARGQSSQEARQLRTSGWAAAEQGAPRPASGAAPARPAALPTGGTR